MTENTKIETVPPDSDPVSDRPQALVVRIGDRSLWLGDGGAAKPDLLANLDFEPSAVVSLTRHRTSATTDHHPLSDAIINDPGVFAAAVETTREYYCDATTTLVHCAAGISRSATVVATTLAAEEDRSFETAVDIVQQHRRRAKPHAKLRINACDYLSRCCERQSEQETLANYARRVSLTRADSDVLAERIRQNGGDPDA